MHVFLRTDRETETEAENNLPKVASGRAQVEHRPQEARAPEATLRMRCPHYDETRKTHNYLAELIVNISIHFSAKTLTYEYS